MNRLIIKVGSVTFALKARDILSARNIRSFVRKTPQSVEGRGVRLFARRSECHGVGHQGYSDFPASKYSKRSGKNDIF